MLHPARAYIMLGRCTKVRTMRGRNHAKQRSARQMYAKQEHKTQVQAQPECGTIMIMKGSCRCVLSKRSRDIRSSRMKADSCKAGTCKAGRNLRNCSEINPMLQFGKIQVIGHKHAGQKHAKHEHPKHETFEHAKQE